MAMAVCDPTAATFFFRQQQANEANRTCCDGCGRSAVEPEWASISHGIYISIEAAGVHRSLGVKVSFVQSITMDSWKPLHLRMMELGGNQRFTEFLQQSGVAEDLPIREKYSTRAAAWYRENLRAMAAGTEAPSPLPPGTGHLPAATGAPSTTEALLDRVFLEAPHGRKRTDKVPIIGAADGDVSNAGGVPFVCRPCPPAVNSICKWACASLTASLRSVLGATTSRGADLGAEAQEVKDAAVEGPCQDCNVRILISNEGDGDMRDSKHGRFADKHSHQTCPAPEQLRKGSPETCECDRPGMPRLSFAARAAMAS